MKTNLMLASLPDHLFVSSSDGGLYDTRKDNWSKDENVVRSKYQWHHREIHTTHEMKACLRAGGFAWPGGYALAFVTDDGAALCYECARKEFHNIVWSIRNKCSDGWRVIGLMNTADCDEPIHCDHCREEI